MPEAKAQALGFVRGYKTPREEMVGGVLELFNGVTRQPAWDGTHMLFIVRATSGIFSVRMDEW